METKACTKCGEVKPATAEFYPRRRKTDNLASWCRACMKTATAAAMLRRRADPEKAQADRAKRNTPEAIAARKAYYAANRERCLAGSAAAYRKNWTKAQEARARWTQENRDFVRSYMREYQARLRSENPNFRLKSSVAARINFSLRARGSSKERRSWESLVGYTLDELCRHIERQFSRGMTWENMGRGGWHIDHRQALSSFTFTSADDPEFRVAWALSNLQPLWAKDNLSKGAKRLTLL